MIARSKTAKIAHPEFAKRLQMACEANPRVPALNYGRFSWIVKEFETRFGLTKTVEGVRKWFIGEAIPRPKALKQLAEIIQVDPAWLSLGVNQVPSPLAAKKGKAYPQNGAVNVLAGFIQLSGGSIAFPSDAESLNRVDLIAIIEGELSHIHVVQGEQVEEGWSFKVDPAALDENNVIVGVLKVSDVLCKFCVLDQNSVRNHGKPEDGFLHLVNVQERFLSMVTSFAEGF